MYSFVLATMMTAGGATPASWGCHGCYGCYGNAFSCYGCYGGCYGCYGGCYGCYGGWYGYYGGYYGGCYGCYGCYGGCYGCYGYYGYAVPVVAAPVVVVAPTPAAPAPPKKGVEVRRDDGPAPARVTVMIPEGSRLLVNDVPVQVNPAARTFETPPLEPGKQYHYVFKADVLRDGRMVRDVQTVDVAAGTRVSVEFRGTPNVAAVRR